MMNLLKWPQACAAPVPIAVLDKHWGEVRTLGSVVFKIRAASTTLSALAFVNIDCIGLEPTV